MEKFEIRVSNADDVFFFEVHVLRQEHCAYQVFENGVLAAVFEPDEQEYLRICDNPAGLDEEVIYQIGLLLEERR